MLYPIIRYNSKCLGVAFDKACKYLIDRIENHDFSQITITLHNIKELIVQDCLKNTSYPSQEDKQEATAIAFSQFLQSLLVRKENLNENAEQLLLELLNTYKDDIFYKSKNGTLVVYQDQFKSAIYFLLLNTHSFPLFNAFLETTAHKLGGKNTDEFRAILKGLYNENQIRMTLLNRTLRSTADSKALASEFSIYLIMLAKVAFTGTYIQELIWFLTHEHKKNASPYLDAVYEGKTDVVKALLDTFEEIYGGKNTKEFQSMLTNRYRNETSALIIASKQNHPYLVDILLKNAKEAFGTITNPFYLGFLTYRNKGGFSALMLAVWFGHLEVMYQLIEALYAFDNGKNNPWLRWHLKNDLFKPYTPIFNGRISSLDCLTPLLEIIFECNKGTDYTNYSYIIEKALELMYTQEKNNPGSDKLKQIFIILLKAGASPNLADLPESWVPLLQNATAKQEDSPGCKAMTMSRFRFSFAAKGKDMKSSEDKDKLGAMMGNFHPNTI